MIYFVSCFLTGFIATLIVMNVSKRYSHLSADHDLSGPQKFHARPVPRVGGVGVVIAIVAGVGVAQLNALPSAPMLWLLLACSLPAFVAGMVEDLTKKVSPRRRLAATAISAGLAIWLLDAVIAKTDIPGVDQLIRWAPLSVLLTIFVITGVANAVNIIDGFNGLASMCVLMMVLALSYVAFQVGDTFVFTSSLITAGAVMGFFVWNFPAGLIFLGDGGAYLLGFFVGELSILLLHRNVGVSPIFPLLLCAYPIFETLFSIYRKKFLRRMSPGVPDGIHLHMLVYKRLMRLVIGTTPDRRSVARNSMTSPYLWVLCLLSVIPAVLWWSNTRVLACFLLLFTLSYVFLYWSIVRFKTPRWLIFRRTG